MTNGMDDGVAPALALASMTLADEDADDFSMDDEGEREDAASALVLRGDIKAFTPCGGLDNVVSPVAVVGATVGMVKEGGGTAGPPAKLLLTAVANSWE